ncbi:MAG TPA: HRDC domain-containing protein [Acidimicrobiales bacterium]|nr:HRDC domain-containing protein [Acidimicrobiales bacterium]
MATLTEVPAGDWIDDAVGLSGLIDELRGEPLYGIDTEFHRERTYWPQLALVQVGWPQGIALVDPTAVDIGPFAEILGGPGVCVMHAADQDLEVLERACGTLPSTLFDTQVAAGFLGFSSPSLSSLTERLLGLRLTKGDRLTDWMQRPLTPGQRRYAAADVAHLLDLHAELVRRLDECERRAWAEQECEALRVRPHTPQDPETAWWRIKDSRSLRGPSRGIAQEVAAWRERRAAHVDKPPRMVLADLALLGVAHRAPASMAELRDIRGLDGRYLKGDAGPEILGAVGRGKELDRTAIRMPPSDELDRNLRPAVTLVSAWVGQLAQELRIDTAMLATRSDLLSLLRGDEDARLARGWRAGLVGDRIRQLVDGRAALAFRPGRGDLVLEARSGEVLGVQVPVPEAIAPAPADPG